MGMTIKQMASARFYQAVNEYRTALENAGDNPSAFVVASLRVHIACRNSADRAFVNRIFKGKGKA